MLVHEARRGEMFAHTPQVPRTMSVRSALGSLPQPPTGRAWRTAARLFALMRLLPWGRASTWDAIGQVYVYSAACWIDDDDGGRTCATYEAITLQPSAQADWHLGAILKHDLSGLPLIPPPTVLPPSTGVK